MYLTITHLDISFAVHQLSWFLDRPAIFHLKGARRILRYLQGTASQGLFFPSSVQYASHSFSEFGLGELLKDSDDPLPGSVSFWAQLSFLGSQRNNHQSLGATQEQNIALAVTICEIQ